MAETYEYLDARDKNTIVENHIRNLEYSMFNNEISIAEASVVTPSDPVHIASLEKEIEDTRAKIVELKKLIVSVPDGQ